MHDNVRKIVSISIIIVFFLSIAGTFGAYLYGAIPHDQLQWLFTILLPVTTLVLGYYFNSAESEESKKEARNRVQEIEEQSKEEPQKVKYAWDLARIKLEAYFDRNLSQINMIFWISVSVMLVGFAFILFSINQTGAEGEAKVNVIGAVAGILTEFIGATFMFVYRSTIQQAKEFMSTLDRINSVGMAVQILDTIPDESTELKANTKAEIVKMLLQHSSSISRYADKG